MFLDNCAYASERQNCRFARHALFLVCFVEYGTLPVGLEFMEHLARRMAQSNENTFAEIAVTFATRSDVGNERESNEDCCGAHAESAGHALIAVADGVGGEEGGEIASQMAIENTLQTYGESPAQWGPAKRLYRAVQKANIEIHDRALVVTELRRMSTTLTAVVVDGNTAHAAHVGDSRLYLIRDGRIVQKTKDHTVAAGKRRMLFASAEMAKDHPEHSMLTRSLGRELIAAVDRITFPVTGGDVLLVCSDGLYNVLSDEELREGTGAPDAAAICEALVRKANERGTPDNLTAAILMVHGGGPVAIPTGWRSLVSRVLGRG
jgi:serine/threonine protein phosphatase PrpC